jgi:hypothetical protein
VGTALGEFMAEERLKIRGELLGEINRLRAEAARERADDLAQLKIQNANLRTTLAKMREEVANNKINLPSSRRAGPRDASRATH